jgi:hypothetical protein
MEKYGYLTEKLPFSGLIMLQKKELKLALKR